MNMDDVIHIPSNGFTLFHRSTEKKRKKLKIRFTNVFCITKCAYKINILRQQSQADSPVDLRKRRLSEGREETSSPPPSGCPVPPASAPHSQDPKAAGLSVGGKVTYV